MSDDPEDGLGLSRSQDSQAADLRKCFRGHGHAHESSGAGTGSHYAEQVAEAERWAVEQVHAAEDRRVLAAMAEYADDGGLVAYGAVGAVGHACRMTRCEVGEALARLFRAGRWIGRHDGLLIVGGGR